MVSAPLDLHERGAEHEHGAPESGHERLLLLVRGADDHAVDRAVGLAEVEVHLLHAGGGEVVDGDRVGSGPAGDVEPLDGVELVAVGEVDLVAGRRAVEHETVEALAALDADAGEPPPADLVVDDAVVAEVDLEPPLPAQHDRVVLGGACDDQRAALDPRAAGGGRLDELALAVARLGAAEVAADPLGERPGELGVGAVGHEEQVSVERDRSAEQPLAGIGVGEQAVAQRLGRDAGHLELDRVRVGVVPRQVVEREHGLLQEAAPDRLRDVVQLAVAYVVDVEGAGAFEGGAAEVGGEEHAVEQLGPARGPAALVDDAGHAAGEAVEAGVEAGVVRVGDQRRVARREDLSVGWLVVRGGGGSGRREHSERQSEGSEHGRSVLSVRVQAAKAGSLSAPTSFPRARWSRLMTVPIGIFRLFAASA